MLEKIEFEFPGLACLMTTSTDQLYRLVQGDCFEWLRSAKEKSIHAVVTDPPFGLIEYRQDQVKKLRAGKGGVWRIPPKLDGCLRKPLPRFTVLSVNELEGLQRFFSDWGRLVLRVLVPGGHVFVASNPLLSPIVSSALMGAGFERRGEIIRLVRTLRGGDRPKLAEKEYDYISVMPRSCYEPWGLFRKPMTEKRVSENLKKWNAGGLRRTPDGRPFPDVIKSEFPLDVEVKIASHPSLKPQKFLRQLVWGALPMQTGIILDPFMGSGSTIAAATALGFDSVGIESDKHFYEMALSAVPQLSKMKVQWESFEGPNGNSVGAKPKKALAEPTLF
ncbi:MAG: DNA methyltransferase [Terriglobia bacterium]|jgi:site-specific DNA-methyltransferase (adenine-specific)